MHFCHCALGIADFFVEDVGNSAVHTDWRFRFVIVEKRAKMLTGLVHGHFKVFDDAEGAKDLANVSFVDIPSQGFDDNLRGISNSPEAPTSVVRSA